VRAQGGASSSVRRFFDNLSPRNPFVLCRHAELRWAELDTSGELLASGGDRRLDVYNTHILYGMESDTVLSAEGCATVLLPCCA
jgi:hypothetical protein